MKDIDMKDLILRKIAKEQGLSIVHIGSSICLFDKKGNRVALVDTTNCTITAFVKELAEQLEKNLL